MRLPDTAILIRLLGLVGCLLVIACGINPLQHPSAPSATAGPDPADQLPGQVQAGIIEGGRVLGCAATGAPLEARVLASDELDGRVITAVVGVTNMGDAPSQALHAFDLQDNQQRLFNMADRVVFPNYPAVEKQDLARWPELQSDSAMIDPGDTDQLLIAFKVGTDSPAWRLAASPALQGHCRPVG